MRESRKFNLPKCFSGDGCLCAAKENIPVLKKSNRMTFLLHANSMCIAASSLMFVAEVARCTLLFAACPRAVLRPPFSLVLLSLIFTNPFSVFSKDDFKKSILSFTSVTLFASPGRTKLHEKIVYTRNFNLTTNLGFL